MKLWHAALLALIAAAPVQSAFAQGVPRIKAKVQSFDGKVLTVTSGTDAHTMSVGVLPSTRYMRLEGRGLTDIAAGNYIGATVAKSKDGVFRATEIHIFPEQLRGSSEGLFDSAGRTMIDATVASANTTILSVTFRGAQGGDGAGCTGLAPRAGGCKGNLDLLVAADVPVTALVPADKALLVPGATIALSVMAGPDGRPVTPGLTFEPDSGAVASTVPAAKPRGR